MIRLLLVDDQDIFRQGLAALLSVESDLEVVGEARNGQEAIELAKTLQPDVILMDVRMPVCDGVQATREIHQYYPWIRILVLTTFDDDEYILKSLQAGALGYLLKRTPSQDIAAAIRSVAQGYSQLGPTIALKVFSQLKPVCSLSNTFQELLTKREIEVLKLIGQGKNNQEIAQELFLSEGTVKNYVTQILGKLKMRDRVQAALW
ncbi:MAG: response regulator transcription factor, partial [Cyanobacteria bacterium J06636_27]